MPLFRFIIHGQDISTENGSVGFFTTRRAFGLTMEEAGGKAMASVRKEWTSGPSSELNRGSPSISLQIEEGRRIGLHEIFVAPNKGNSLYDGDDGRDAARRIEFAASFRKSL
jgi:hypothetical protein